MSESWLVHNTHVEDVTYNPFLLVPFIWFIHLYIHHVRVFSTRSHLNRVNKKVFNIFLYTLKCKSNMDALGGLQSKIHCL
ncbi:hypothetical protein GDO81_009482 [Engystomops pustulosus]|uniref:Uncharacterized protein n=1 Tax=Engystomops pustulosus TaxID=76066 RepID=A0AAV7BRX4_ENGPU|nr:hypothetical protein GDO81_009482 [Engystomops pustulosus]